MNRLNLPHGDEALNPAFSVAPIESPRNGGPHRGPISKMSYDLSSNSLKFVVRSTCDSDTKRANISLKKLIYEHYLRRSYD